MKPIGFFLGGNHLCCMECILSIFQQLCLVKILALSVALDRPLVYNLIEERPPGTIVFSDLATAAGLTAKYPADVLRLISYTIIGQQGQTRDFFRLDERTGQLKTVKVINRDAICRQQWKCLIGLDIAIHPAQYFEIIKVEVAVTDINDSPPVFAPNRLTLSLLESTQPKELVPIIPATDLDSPPNGVVEYRLQPTTDRFALRVRNRTTAGEVDLRLVLLQALDREERDRYQMQVLALDGGSPRLTGTLSIDINIMDVNDNSPRFDNTSYLAGVTENQPVGTTVLRVLARDPDAGLNGHVRYQFSRRTQAVNGDTFSIDSVTGEIVLLRPARSLAQTVYSLAVIAEDQGENSVPSMVSVTITVHDVNEHRPSIAIDGNHSEGGGGGVEGGGKGGNDDAVTIEVSEHGHPNISVAMVSVTDEDRGVNGKVACSLEGPGDSFALVQVFESEYKVMAMRSLDYDVEKLYHLSIRCHDHGQPQLMTVRNLSIVVTDASLGAPVFSSSAYNTSIRENNAPNEAIFSVSASVRGRKNKAKVLYTLDPDARGRFSIEPESGLITARSIFDREQTSIVEFHVAATILGQDGSRYTSKAFVRVTILDTDDESPRFAQPKYTFFISENATVRTEIGRISAVDRDLPPFNKFWYDVEHEPTWPVASFGVDPLTGDLFTQTPLDREKKEVYVLTARVYSSGPLKAADTTTINVIVTDVNDNAPLIVFPSHSNDTVKISPSHAVGEIVTTVVASDDDIGPNAQLTYVIINGNDDVIFRLASDTGILWLHSNISPNSLGTIFALSITVRDGGLPSLNTSTLLRLEVSEAQSKFPLDYHKQTTKDGGTGSGSTGSGGGLDDNQIIIVVMAVAGCLAVLVACALIVALIQKNVRKMADRKVVWSQLIGSSDADAQQQQQQQTRPQVNGNIRSAPETEVEDKSSFQVTELSDIILSLESEPVSFATRQRLSKINSEDLSPTRTGELSCRSSGSPVLLFNTNEEQPQVFFLSRSLCTSPVASVDDDDLCRCPQHKHYLSCQTRDMYGQSKAACHSERKQRRKLNRGHESEEEEEEEENDADAEEEEEMLRFKDRLLPSIPETGCHPLLPIENSMRTEDEEVAGEKEEAHIRRQKPDLGSSGYHHYGHNLEPSADQTIKWKDKKKQVHFARGD